MKKSLALILAAMMVAGTASVAFAAKDFEPSEVRMADDSEVYVWNSDDNRYELVKNNTVEYGKKVAFGIVGPNSQYPTDSDEVKNLKAYPEYKVGEGLVAVKPTVEYRKVYNEGSAGVVKDYSVKSTASGTKKIEAGSQSPMIQAILAKIDLSGADSALANADVTLPAKLNSKDETVIRNAVKVSSPAIASNSNALDGLCGYITDNFDDLYTPNMEGAIKEGTSYRYVIELQLKESTTTASKDFFGEMYVGRTSNGAKENKDPLSFNLKVENKRGEEGKGSDSFEVKGKENYVIEFDDCDVVDIEFMSSGNSSTSYALFTVDASGQSKQNVGFNVKYNKDIAAKYPDANLEFLTFTANPTFNRTGELWIYADEDSYIYEVTADGLKEIKNAEYDESDEAWYIKTRTLKNYVVSDVELDVKASESSSSEASSSETSSSNPSTGGTTGTGSNTNVKPNPNTGR